MAFNLGDSLLKGNVKEFAFDAMSEEFFLNDAFDVASVIDSDGRRRIRPLHALEMFLAFLDVAAEPDFDEGITQQEGIDASHFDGRDLFNCGGRGQRDYIVLEVMILQFVEHFPGFGSIEHLAMAHAPLVSPKVKIERRR